MDEALISIGQFASLTWLSPKALRLYQSQGILEPVEVDPRSGYRYYSASQISIARRIALLRRAGVALADIAAFLDAPSKDQIDRWQQDLDVEIAERSRILDEVARTLDSTEVTAMPTDPSAAQLQRAVPVLASLDIEATQRFYAEKLGFTALARYPDYGIVERDDVQIHFFLTEDADLPKATSCRVDVEGVDQLYEELRASGVVHPHGELTDQPWGLREFAVLDGDGNLIKFGQRTAT